MRQFYANGDIIEILEIFNIKELYGFKFAKVKNANGRLSKADSAILLLDTIKANLRP
jgi:hypothetical protein